jgi:hypothetical protein
MRATQPSPFDTLETCFRLLTTGPEPLALDGRKLGHSAPARRVPLGELRILLQHPAAQEDLQRVVLQELARLATQHRGSWTIGLAGVLLPGLREIASAALPIDARVASQVEADVLERFRHTIQRPALEVVEFAISVLGLARSDRRSPCTSWPPRPGAAEGALAGTRAGGKRADAVAGPGEPAPRPSGGRGARML